jgi:hypothetical protein
MAPIEMTVNQFLGRADMGAPATKVRSAGVSAKIWRAEGTVVVSRLAHPSPVDRSMTVALTG